jgi:uncharacterized protein (DUF952 family)
MRQPRTGAYTTASLREDGFIHCSMATQHATVANNLFAGRTDLVLLLIDTDTLSSAVRFEPSDPGGAAFPHVYGPVILTRSLRPRRTSPGRTAGSTRTRKPAGSAPTARPPSRRPRAGRWR